MIFFLEFKISYITYYCLKFKCIYLIINGMSEYREFSWALQNRLAKTNLEIYIKDEYEITWWNV